jgi:hypothetical protein
MVLGLWAWHVGEGGPWGGNSAVLLQCLSQLMLASSGHAVKHSVIDDITYHASSTCCTRPCPLAPSLPKQFAFRMVFGEGSPLFWYRVIPFSSTHTQCVCRPSRSVHMACPTSGTLFPSVVLPFYCVHADDDVSLPRGLGIVGVHDSF